MSMKRCSKCEILCPLTEFYFRKDSNKYRSECKDCFAENGKAYRNAHKKDIKRQKAKHYRQNKEAHKARRQRYYTENKDAWAKRVKIWQASNPDKVKKYKQKWELENREHIRARKNARRQSNSAVRLRRVVSKAVWYGLKRNGGNKNRLSITKFLEYSIDELKLHLESKFDDWMIWDNWGIYSLTTWDDNDPSTWTWQIDHIIPHSNFYYTSMTDEAFKACWALTNLRPYSSKLNIIEGDRC